MLQKISLIFKNKDLKTRIGVILLILLCSRILSNIPIPGIDIVRLREIFATNQLFGFLSLFSGGSLDNLSIVMLGVGPYITASIILQLLTMVFPSLKSAYYEEGVIGRAKFNRNIRQLTLPLTIVQSYAFLTLLTNQGVFSQFNIINVVFNVLIITAGTMILVWFSDIISEQKLGNGMSILIFTGIISNIPANIRNISLTFNYANLPSYISLLIIGFLVILGVVYINESERKIPVSYSRQSRNGSNQVVSSFLPLKVNQAGVVPIIFAISILLFPQFLTQITALFSEKISHYFSIISNYILNNNIIYGIIYFILIVFFTYFYTSVTFEPKEIANNLVKSGGFIENKRPGKETAEYLEFIMNRVTFYGALFLGVIAILPIITQSLTNINNISIGGTGLLIIVSVAIETIRQIDAELSLKKYEY